MTDRRRPRPVPPLVTRPDVRLGRGEPRSFEDSLRRALRESPYAAASGLVHLAVLWLLMTLPATRVPDDVPPSIRGRTGTPWEAIEEPSPDPAGPEPFDDPVDEPVIAEEVAELAPVERPIPDHAQLELLRARPAPRSDAGKLSRRGGEGPRGGSDADEAVARALDWLAAHQADDGSWSSSDFDEQCGALGGDVVCDGFGRPGHDVGVTGLALLAFLAAGHTHGEGPYRDVVRAGLRFLDDAQDPATGAFGSTRDRHYTYDHIIATLAAVEAYALTRMPMLRRMADDGLAHMFAIRNAGEAWRYAPHDAAMHSPSSRNDVSVTGWAVLVMALARDYGLEVDEAAIEDSYRYLDAMTDARGRTGYVSPGSRSPRVGFTSRRDHPPDRSEALTAVAVLSRVFLDPDLARPGNREAVDRGVALMLENLPSWEARDFYYWYYGSYAMFQVGGRAWTRWRREIVGLLVEHQRTKGERRGSWDPDCAWGGVGGRVYSTAMLTLCLEVFYRYDDVLGENARRARDAAR